ncbi:MAG: hypothetical protein JXP34_08665 [Planctomycetes bacterium]|nr:hypothetical protein [Planctomycetota bacterium]
MGVLWIAVCMLVPAADAEIVSIRTRDGRTIVGRVEGIDDAGNYVGKTVEGTRLAIPERDVLSVDLVGPPPTEAAPETQRVADEDAIRELVRKILAEEFQGAIGGTTAVEEPASTQVPASPPSVFPAPPSPAPAAPAPAPASEIPACAAPTSATPAPPASSPPAVSAIPTSAVGASPAPPPPADMPAPPSRWFPVAPGTWWVYRRDGAPGRSRERWEIASATPIEGGTIRLDVAIRTLDEDPPRTARRAYYLGGDSLAVGALPGNGGDILLRSPLREGEDWVWSTTARRFRRTCRSLSETVHTPAGTFTGCLSIRAERAIKGLEGFSVAETITFAPDVGIVRIEGEDPLVLVEYGADGAPAGQDETAP